jgi:hypothetical protein
MSLQPQNKPVAICIAGLTAITLTGVAVLLNAVAPPGVLTGLLVRVVSLAALLPVVLFGFNILCDRCDGQQNTAALVANPTEQAERDEIEQHEEQAELSGLVYRGIPLEANNPQRRFSAPFGSSSSTRRNGREHNGNSAGQIVVPVSIQERSFRTVAPGKKWWVGQ